MVKPDGRLSSWNYWYFFWPDRQRAETRPPRLGERDNGFWAFKTRTRALEHLVTIHDCYPAPENAAAALGRVSLWGTYVEAKDGYRAEYAYPFELFLFPLTRPFDGSLAGLVRERYAVEVSLLEIAESEYQSIRVRGRRDPVWTNVMLPDVAAPRFDQKFVPTRGLYWPRSGPPTRP
jgi:hypothetical protein